MAERRKVGKFMFATQMPAGHWTVSSKNGAFLGTIELEPKWRQFVLVPSVNSMFSWDCLRDLALFLDDLNQARQEVDRG